jgi:hypothetical protein
MPVASEVTVKVSHVWKTAGFCIEDWDDYCPYVYVCDERAIKNLKTSRT